MQSAFARCRSIHHSTRLAHYTPVWRLSVSLSAASPQSRFWWMAFPIGENSEGRSGSQEIGAWCSVLSCNKAVCLIPMLFMGRCSMISLIFKQHVNKGRTSLEQAVFLFQPSNKLHSGINQDILIPGQLSGLLQILQNPTKNNHRLCSCYSFKTI